MEYHGEFGRRNVSTCGVPQVDRVMCSTCSDVVDVVDGCENCVSRTHG